MIKPKLWKGNDLQGTWTVSRKIDGIRALKIGKKVVSRNGKPLYNLDHLSFVDVEVFCGTWEETVSAVRTMSSTAVPKKNIYSLDPLDKRLFISDVVDPSAGSILDLLKEQVALGDEGLVLRQGDMWLKVKPFETYDVEVTGLYPGKGKHAGRLGGFYTSKGKVGTGLTDKQREEFMTVPVGTIIEVECWQLTPKGKFRHPRFKRIRWDK